MNLLSIGGSDPSSGSGIQGDIRAFSSLGAHCLSAVTAVTAQNTSMFGGVEPVSPGILGEQIKCIMADFDLAGIKIGMVYNQDIIKVIHRTIRKTGIPIVVDPVVRSTTGGVLLERQALKSYKKLLVPLATAITPNQEEAGILAGVRSHAKAARIIRDMGAKNVIVTGIKKGGKISDYILEKDAHRTISDTLIRGTNRGSGGVHSAAVLFCLASGHGMCDAARFAKQAAHESIKNAIKHGRGLPITDAAPITRRLLGAIHRIMDARGISGLIPECQTNFVHSGPNPKNTGDVLGVAGRIVRVGNHTVMAGQVRYGGSKHVASALIAASKKFPQLRAAANIRYSESVVSAAKAAGMRVSVYDRSREPESAPSTISWGIKSAVSGIKRPPDIIYHTGGWGKEPMIMVFGITPDAVAEKITRLIDT